MLDLKKLREIAEKSTDVVGWYPHGPYDEYHPGQASVRGPFGRWFLLSGGDNGMGDPVKYPTPVADLEDDAKFAAAAMNSLVPLLDLVEKYEEALRLISMRKEGFEEDSYRCIEIADEALATTRQATTDNTD